MDYDVVIPTCNRPDVLGASIPLILRQERPPRQLIVVDASDEHEQTRQSVVRAAADSTVKIEILHSQQANSSLQRNVGLGHVKSPVVMFTDDDVFWWPSAGESIMRIYERDTNSYISGVCGALVTSPPPNAQLALDASYKMNLSDRIIRKIQLPYNRFISRFCPDPLWIHGRSRLNVCPTPEWLPEENAVRVEFMGGGRMSFRTEVIRDRGLDPDLGAYWGYAKAEDVEVSFYVMQKYLVVGTRNAQMYHHTHPGRRAGGFKVGFVSVWNPVYIICKYSSKGSAARKAVKQFFFFKLIQYLVRAHTKFGRERVRGTLSAIRLMNKLLDAPPDTLRECYLETCERVMRTEAGES